MHITRNADGTAVFAVDQPQPGRFAVQVQAWNAGTDDVESAMAHFSRQELEAIRDGINTALQMVHIPVFKKEE